MFSLKNKVAVVTGGGSGIGQAMSILFARQGAFVHILELTEIAAANTLKQIYTEGGQAVSHVCNVAHQHQVKTVFNGIGAIHILVNNAGIAHIGNAENTAEEDFDRVFSVNVKGFYNCIHAVVPIMRAVGGGSIINMASVAAHVGIPDRFAYSMSKGAAYAMTLATAKDFIKDNIRCNSISPARVHTPFVDGFLAKNYAGREAEMFDKLSQTQPIGRMGKPDEIAALALYLCSDEASFITGTDYPIDGGFMTLNN
jgi:2-keto-3-deoxy-L-fuconate dehydrogenase